MRRVVLCEIYQTNSKKFCSQFHLWFGYYMLYVRDRLRPVRSAFQKVWKKMGAFDEDFQIRNRHHRTAAYGNLSSRNVMAGISSRSRKEQHQKRVVRQSCLLLSRNRFRNAESADSVLFQSFPLFVRRFHGSHRQDLGYALTWFTFFEHNDFQVLSPNGHLNMYYAHGTFILVWCSSAFSWYHRINHWLCRPKFCTQLERILRKGYSKLRAC